MSSNVNGREKKVDAPLRVTLTVTTKTEDEFRRLCESALDNDCLQRAIRRYLRSCYDKQSAAHQGGTIQ
jgi:hypothetical protein